MFRLWSPPASLLAIVIYIIGIAESQSVTCNTSMVSSVIEWATYSFSATTTNWPYVSNHPECRSYMSSLEGYRHPPSTDSPFTSATVGNPTTFLTETSDRTLSLETWAAATSDFTSLTLRKTCSKGERTPTGGQTMSFSSTTETYPLYISSLTASQPFSSASSSTFIPANTTVTVDALTLTETETVFESLSTDFGSVHSYSRTGTSYFSASGSSTTIQTTAPFSTTSSPKICTRRVTKSSTLSPVTTSST